VVATAPAGPAAVLRYAAAGGWCAPYAEGWRRAGVAYAWTVALPATTAAYSVAWLSQWAAGLPASWLPPPTPGVGRVERWLSAQPPALAELVAAAAPSGARRVAGYGAVAVSAVAYAAAWVVQRPGRLAAAAALATVVWIFVFWK
jgi:hypothetical protein